MTVIISPAESMPIRQAFALPSRRSWRARMEFAKFARTGLAVSRLCIGTGTFGKQPEEAEANRILDEATEAGVNFIDTADLYPPGVSLGSGASETITGRWLADKRGRFFLGT